MTYDEECKILKDVDKQMIEQNFTVRNHIYYSQLDYEKVPETYWDSDVDEKISEQFADEFYPLYLELCRNSGIDTENSNVDLFSSFCDVSIGFIISINIGNEEHGLKVIDPFSVKKYKE